MSDAALEDPQVAVHAARQQFDDRETRARSFLKRETTQIDLNYEYQF